MKALLITFISFVAIVVGSAVWAIGMYVSNANYANTAEQGIKAQYDNNRNILSNYTTRIMEMAQVNDMYRDDLMKVVEATFSGRYGADGSKAVFQFIQENNMTLDSSMYKALQSSMESGRLEFQAGQTALIDKRRAYETAMGFLVQGFFIKMAGYPKIDLNKYDIIVEQSTTDRFNTKVDAPMKLR
jgi:hypothetical protein